MVVKINTCNAESPLAEGRELKSADAKGTHRYRGSPLAEGRELKYLQMLRLLCLLSSPLAEGRELKCVPLPCGLM